MIYVILVIVAIVVAAMVAYFASPKFKAFLDSKFKSWFPKKYRIVEVDFDGQTRYIIQETKYWLCFPHWEDYIDRTESNPRYKVYIIKSQAETALKKLQNAE